MPLRPFTYLLLLIATPLLFNATCENGLTLGPSAERADRYEKRISYHRGSCFGRCEVYTLDVYANGLITFAGERFTDKPGLWQRNIDRRRLAGLLDSFERAGFAGFPSNFVSQMPDAPAVTMTYVNPAGETFTTTYRENYPDALIALDRRMRELATSPEFRQVSTTIPDDTKTPMPTSDAAREEIIVHLKPGVPPETWIIAYGKQNVKLKERISPNGDYYLLEADPNLMGADELLGFLRSDENVLSAQRNGAVRSRF